MRRHQFNPVAEISTLVDLLRWRARLQGDQRVYTFLHDGEAEESYLTLGVLDAKARAIGAELQRLDLAGERAVLLYPPGWEFVTAFFGCLYAGVVAVPVYFPRINRPMTRFRAIVGNAKPCAVLTSANNPLDRDRWLAQVPEIAGLHWIVSDTIPDQLADDWRDPGVARDTLAFLQYTSGSTALPKGVMNTHGNLLHNSEVIQACLEPVPFRGVFWLPFYHDLGLIGGILQTLFRGGTSTLMPPVAFLQRPLRWLQAISRNRATISGGPNFAYDLLVSKTTPEQREKLDLSSWSVAFCGAEPIRSETIDRFCRTFEPCGLRPEAFSPGYGLAEATLLVSGGPAWAPPALLTVQGAAIEQNRIVEVPTTTPDARTFVGCGRMPESQTVAIVDPTTRERCPDDRIGEIWVSGPSVAQGYWKQPEATEHTFQARIASTGEGPFLRTGDLGFRHGDQLFVTGRLKDMIIIRGRNIYPQDIEHTVELCHPALRPAGCAAFAIELANAERLVVVQEVERHGRDADLDEVIRSIRQAIVEHHELEVHAVWLLKSGTVPKTSSGKIQRHAAREGFLNDRLEVIARFEQVIEQPDLEPASPTESDPALPDLQAAALIQEWLTARLAALLGIRPAAIDPRRPFASLGLGSMQAVTLAGDLQDWLGYPVSPTLVYEHPNVELLVRHLSAEAQRAGLALKPEGAPRPGPEPIAIIGIGCRFPGASGPEAFWRLLVEGVDAISEVPADRWSAGSRDDADGEHPERPEIRWGGFLDRIDRFDAEFFGISPREAIRTDPQQRMLLEVAWEALEDAGQAPERLAGSEVGVFVGIATNDYNRLQWESDGRYDPYSITGNASSIAANRLSYLFDFRGPSLAVDTACSSSLVAIQLACQCLRNGEAALALAGGVNAILAPEISANFARAGFLSPDGRCKTFDARANGYVRGEGAGLIVLKPLSRAQADGDPIYAVIRGGAVNQDGGTNGLTAPSQRAQEAVLRAAYQQAGVSPGQVQYVEAHGTGTLLGDPIEAKALGAVLAEGRPEGQPCAVGSVKTNIGHLEAAGGVAGVIKVALALRHRMLPASLHFTEPNPHIPFDSLPIQVQRVAAPWPASDGRSVAGVSAFGFGGTNAHLVVEGIPPAPAPCPAEVPPAAGTAMLIPLSARSPKALRALAQAYRDRLALASDDPQALGDIAYSAAVRRNHHEHRLAIVARTAPEAVKGLDAALGEEKHASVARGHRGPGLRPKVAFVFSGQGVQFPGMARGLLEREPVARDLLEQCDEWLREHAGWSLIDEIRADAAASRLARPEIAQPTLFALQAALTALWRSWGIRPDAVVGHSVGELAAAHAAGVLSLNEALRIISLRGQLMQRVAGHGLTAAVELSVSDARRLIAGLEDRLSIAALNAPRLTTISGAPHAIREVVRSLEAKRIFAYVLPVDCAFHSPQMDLIRDELESLLGQIVRRNATALFISTVTGQPVTGPELDAAHWARNLRETVQFSAAIDRLAQAGCEFFVEIGPHPTLASAISQNLRQKKREGTVLASLRRGEDDREALLHTLGVLYAQGLPVDWRRLHPSGRYVSLPTYPWQHQRFWPEVGHKPAAPRNGLPESSPSPRFVVRNGTAAPHNGSNGHTHSPAERDDSMIHRRSTNGNGTHNGSHAVEENLNDLLYELQWRPEETAPAAGGLEGRWILFADGGGVSSKLAALIKAHGADCLTVVPGTPGRRSGACDYVLNPAAQDDFERLLAELEGGDPSPLQGIVYLWGMDASFDRATGPGELETAQRLACGGLLYLIQALANRGPGAPRVWVVTRGAQAVGPDGPVPGLLQSPLWGMGRALALEHPELWGGQIDLDPEPTSTEPEGLLESVLAPNGETQIALRRGQRHVARLVPRAPLTAHPETLALRPDATYLITGGLGGLGLQVAHWMVDHGARRLVLLSRRSLPDRRSWDGLAANDPARPAVGAIRAMERLGATVMTVAADTADEPRMSALFEELGATFPPLRGIVHAAGQIRPCAAGELEFDAFLSLVRPKVTGSWVLHRLTRDLPLDFFILFSSISSVWGSQRLVDYSAANGFLDALAHQRRAEGLPALSINWGPWADVGMATQSDWGRSLELMGLVPLRPETAVRAMSLLAGSGATQTTVADVDWATFKALYSQAGRGALLEQIFDRQRSGPKRSAPGGGALADWREVPPEHRRDWLIRYFSDCVGRVLGLEPSRLDPNRPLNTLGLGSLVAMELKSRTEADLGLALPLASLFQGPTIAQLASEMLERLSEPAPLQNTALAPAQRHVAEHPLSYNQSSLWYLNRLSPTGGLYHIAGAARMRMEVNVDALRRTFQRLVDRHPMLRTTFQFVGEELVQRVHDAMDVYFVVEDASETSLDELRARLVEEAYRPYDLERGPVIRAHLFRRSPREYYFLLGIHHIVSDFWSIAVIMSEMGEIYPAECAGTDPGLPPLEFEYTDFVRWQAEMLAGPEGTRHWEYWREQLSGHLPDLNLPTDRPRPAIQSHRGAETNFFLDPTLTQRLIALGASHGASLYITLLSAFKVLLHRYTGQTDIIVGSPVAGRNRPGLAGLVGDFVNTAPMRTNLAGDPPFHEFLVRVRQTVLDGLEHQDFPFSLMVDRLQPPRDPSRSPVFQVMFVFQKAQVLDEQGMTLFALHDAGPTLHVGGLALESAALDQRAARFDLVMTTAVGAGRLAVSVEYNTDLFDASTIDRLLGHFRTLLEGIVANPRQRLSDLPILSAAEQRQLLQRWASGPSTPPPTLPPAPACDVVDLDELSTEELDDLIASLSEDEAETDVEGAPDDLGALTDEELDGLIATLSDEADDDSPPVFHTPDHLDRLSDQELDSLILLLSHEHEAIDE